MGRLLPRDQPSSMNDHDELLPDDALINDDALLRDGAADPGERVNGEHREARAGASRRWCVLVVDDDQDLRAITQLALLGAEVDGVELEVVCVASGAEARRFLRGRADVAVALVDVVMESDAAGLELVAWVRTELRDPSIRLVVRTGQPGSAPESRVMSAYDIHDYLGKSETTARRLVSCVTGGVRAWRDLRGIRRQREGLQRVLRAINGLFQGVELGTLFSTLTDEIVALNAPHVRGAALLGVPGLAPDRAAPARVLAAAGRYADLAGADAAALVLDGGAPPEFGSIPPGGVVARPGVLLYAFDVAPDVRPVLVCAVDELAPWDQELTSLYAHAATLALRSRLQWIRTVADISSSLAARDLALKELQHRVKNNLQLISSMLSMQAGTHLPDEAKAVIVDSELRVRSIALVHQLLHGSEDHAHVDLGAAVRTLAHAVAAGLDIAADVEVTAAPIWLPIDRVIPCSMLLNELITNAIKHGRSPDGRCRVHVALTTAGDQIELSCRDEGPGLPQEPAAPRHDALGMSIVVGLVQQLRGVLRIDRGEPGACFVVTIPQRTPT